MASRRYHSTRTHTTKTQETTLIANYTTLPIVLISRKLFFRRRCWRNHIPPKVFAACHIDECPKPLSCSCANLITRIGLNYCIFPQIFCMHIKENKIKMQFHFHGIFISYKAIHIPNLLHSKLNSLISLVRYYIYNQFHKNLQGKKKE